MRSWYLLGASLSASLGSVFSFILPYCLFLNFQQNHLLHVVSNAMQVMLYLIPFLIVLAFLFYVIVLSVLKLPSKIFDVRQFLKISLVFFTGWICLVLMILFEDQVNTFDVETFAMSLFIFVAVLPVFAVGCISANICYFLMCKKNDRGFGKPRRI
ncbi:hypothetical protein F909_01669 [Acinetobacter sp. ANC 3929]|uniref:hypothetical protein n=1 Tax=unclassified Acinetobacter TaxID=196816 RepID=UPI0002D136D7|nr:MULTISPECIES: hypothetical protein [unclassified Acinetobacter]ENW81980.1 hypothetical protein F909_01669 [Acinetobacter sp. ANC 3929]MCH7352684.1 hypothetical protein [Acinetobacter sp. NIPH 2023]MCH7356730.1 hypothetical protein [Acinetobacter sp. NIPH 1958]MCH7359990.1 hypothetical protein [Acinetobacter sp. NIPH 2024]